MAFAPGTLATDPSQMAGLNPSNNLGGGSLTGFLSPSPVTSLGGGQNPFAPSFPTGQKMPGSTSPGTAPGTAPAPGGAPAPANISAYSSPYSSSGATSALAGMQGVGIPQGNSPGTAGPWGPGFNKDLAQSLQHTYYGGAGTDLAKFIAGGAGYNPNVAAALIAQLQPQFAQGQANIMEQFGSMGLGDSSAAALGLGAYDAQSNQAVGVILAGLYEQSIQNYLGILEGTHGQGTNFGQTLAQTVVGGIMGGGASVSTGGTGGTKVSI
jgi:hypothetical protein